MIFPPKHESLREKVDGNGARTGEKDCSPRIFRGPRDVHFWFLAQRQIFVAARDPVYMDGV